MEPSDVPSQPRRLQITANIYLDRAAQAVIVGDALTPVPAIEYRLLDYLARHAGQVVPVDALAKVGWADGWPRGCQDVYYHIHRVRRLLGDLQHPHRIVQARRGVGYVLAPYRSEVKG